jgi:DNA-binding response OmpR family regulator
MPSTTVPRILVVDDDNLFRMALKDELERQGYHVVEAATGREARQLFTADLALAIFDYRLPDTTAVELLASLTASGVRIPVIVVTACRERGADAAVILGGAYEFLDKLDDSDHILPVVRAALAKWGHSYLSLEK